jgi:hypothetical protein
VERRLSASKDDKGITLIENVDPNWLSIWRSWV